MLNITRYPHRATMLRGANMLLQFCQKCEKRHSHGYYFYEHKDLPYSFFVCDICLFQAVKESK